MISKPVNNFSSRFLYPFTVNKMPYVKFGYIRLEVDSNLEITDTPNMT